MMQRRQITLEDGRYLIFYTFDAAPPADAPTRAAERTPEPHAQSEAEEERDV